MKHSCCFVCALLNDGLVKQLSQSVMCIFIYFIYASVMVLEFLFVMLVGHRIEPVCGYTGLRKQRKRPQDVSSSLLRTILQVLKCILDRHAKSGGRVFRVVVSRDWANDTFAPVGIQSV